MFLNPTDKKQFIEDYLILGTADLCIKYKVSKDYINLKAKELGIHKDKRGKFSFERNR